jgi:hypothetical protein
MIVVPTISKQIYPHLHNKELQSCFMSCSKLFYCLLRCKHNLLHCNIMFPCMATSQWQCRWSSFTLITGLLWRVFQSLMDILSSRSTWSICCNGRPRSLSPSAEIGFFLFYIGSTLTIKHLCLIFGTTPAVCSCSLKNVESNSPCTKQTSIFQSLIPRWNEDG